MYAKLKSITIKEGKLTKEQKDAGEKAEPAAVLKFEAADLDVSDSREFQDRVGDYFTFEPTQSRLFKQVSEITG